MIRLNFDNIPGMEKRPIERSPSFRQLLWSKLRLSTESTPIAYAPGGSHAELNNNDVGGCLRNPAEDRIKLWFYAYFREEGESCSLVVVCSTIRECRAYSEDRKQIFLGGNNEPFFVPNNEVIKLSLRSSVLKADEPNGEDQALCKTELFQGYAFEKQFALRKEADSTLRGTIGKVSVNVISQSSGDIISIGDFNLIYYKCQERQSQISEEDQEWLVLGYKELCETLGILEENSSLASLCQELGFTQREIGDVITNAKNSSTDDIITNCTNNTSSTLYAILKHFRNRNGTAREFIHKLYQCKRNHNLDHLVNGTTDEVSLTAQLSDVSSAPAQLSSGTNIAEEDLTEACLLLTPPATPVGSKRRCRGGGQADGGFPVKRPRLRLNFNDNSLGMIEGLGGDNDSGADAETIPADDIELHVFPPTPRKLDAPLSPPLTPLKRLISFPEKRSNRCDVFVFPESGTKQK